MSTQQITEKVDIVSGPSHLEVCNSFAYAFNLLNPHTALFRLLVGQAPVSIRAKVTGLTYESGAEGMFVIKANFILLGRNVTAEGFYDAKRQTGHFNVPIR